MREARAAEKLNHPNTVIIHENDESGEDTYSAMEYGVGGMSLRDVIQRSELPIDWVTDIAIQIILK
ncbi:hypothetical protein ACFL6I_14870 [candidate division KSB1 bacterium]